MPKTKKEKSNWRLWISYDGTDFCGWQKQPGQRSVEGELLKALKSLTGQEVEITVGGRTDAGVHARLQACSVSFESDFDSRRLILAFAAKLPRDIVVVGADKIFEKFDARSYAVGKRYVYKIKNSLASSPFVYKYAWHVKGNLDLVKMREAAKYLVGELDYESFRSTECGAAHARRYLWQISVSASFDFDIRGNAFCHNMIRIIVGTLVDVGLGRFEPKDIEVMLEAKDRTQAGKTAPAHGLTLDQIYYPDDLTEAAIPDDAKFPRFPVTKETWPI